MCQGGCSLTHSARTPPARVNQKKHIFGPPSDLDVEKKYEEGKKKEIRKKEECQECPTHNVRAHALSSDQS